MDYLIMFLIGYMVGSTLKEKYYRELEEDLECRELTDNKEKDK